MLFSLQSPAIDDSSAPPENLSTAGGKLIQLQDFFEGHNFDTAGPYSDLFTVLLSCCKHLVDSGLKHHAALSAQRCEIARLSSEIEGLRELTAFFQDTLREVRQDAVRVSEPLAAKLEDLESVCERIGTAESQIRTLRHNADVLRRHADMFEESKTHMQSVQEDVQKLQRGIAAHAEYVDGEFSALRDAVQERKGENREVIGEAVQLDISVAAERMQQYADRRVNALRTELCTALRESSERRDSPRAGHSGNVHSAGTTRARYSPSSGESLADGFRHFHVSSERVDQIENRLEALEVYAPHQCAMAARPPLLGLELRDDCNSGAVQVEKVYSGFAAEAVGFAPGDLVIAVNGQEIHTRAEIYAVMTEAAREHQAQCRLTAMAYYKRQFKEYGGSDAVNNSGLVKSNNGMNEDCGMPLLVLSFHVKRGGLLREITVTAERSESAQQ